ncbi:hypothetical protein BC829DRAFT_390639 [Chytridium lagenaria]|nr:hypothetical protein BC829DRAFT_390639 [Chytridium lagenaria]
MSSCRFIPSSLPPSTPYTTFSSCLNFCWRSSATQYGVAPISPTDFTPGCFCFTDTPSVFIGTDGRGCNTCTNESEYTCGSYVGLVPTGFADPRRQEVDAKSVFLYDAVWMPWITNAETTLTDRGVTVTLSNAPISVTNPAITSLSPSTTVRSGTTGNVIVTTRNGTIVDTLTQSGSSNTNLIAESTSTVTPSNASPTPNVGVASSSNVTIITLSVCASTIALVGLIAGIILFRRKHNHGGGIVKIDDVHDISNRSSDGNGAADAANINLPSTPSFTPVTPVNFISKTSNSESTLFPAPRDVKSAAPEQSEKHKFAAWVRQTSKEVEAGATGEVGTPQRSLPVALPRTISRQLLFRPRIGGGSDEEMPPRYSEEGM